MAENIAFYKHPSNTVLSYATVDSSGNIGSLTTLDNLRSINPPRLQKQPAPATSISSTSKQLRKRPGWEDPGVLSFTAYRDKGAQFAALYAYYLSEQMLFFQITIPGGQTEQFTGYFEGIQPGVWNPESNELVFDEYSVQLTDGHMAYTTDLT